jgi:hypothetical protein
MNTESFSKVRSMGDHALSCRNSAVPVSPRDWSAGDFEVPENLKFVKAKLALVPVPAKAWTDIEISAEEVSELK